MDGKIRGVNLGGWLVLEKWMKPELFDGTEAADETGFSKDMDHGLAARLKKHRDTFITEQDFAWIAQTGLNTVRLPVPWWMLGQQPPYVGCANYVARAFSWAEKYHLQVMLDLHCAPGCQNGFDNGGIAGVMEWHLHEENITKTLEVLQANLPICKTLFGAGFHSAAQRATLGHTHRHSQNLLSEGIRRVRRCFSPSQCAVVLHDSFRQDLWEGFPARRGKCADGAAFYQVSG